MWILTGPEFVVDTCHNKYLPKSFVTMFDLYSIWGGSGKTAKAKVGFMGHGAYVPIDPLGL